MTASPNFNSVAETVALVVVVFLIGALVFGLVYYFAMIGL